jgi:hypothetical protein
MWMMGVLLSAVIITTVNLRMALETRYWTWLVHLAIWGQIALFWIVLLLYSLIIWWHPFEIGFIYFMIYNWLSTPVFYFLFLLIMITALLPSFLGKFIQWQYFTHSWQHWLVYSKATRTRGKQAIEIEMSKV